MAFVPTPSAHQSRWYSRHTSGPHILCYRNAKPTRSRCGIRCCADLQNGYTAVLTAAIKKYPRPKRMLPAQVCRARPSQLIELSSNRPCVTSTKPSSERKRPIIAGGILRSPLTHTSRATNTVCLQLPSANQRRSSCEKESHRKKSSSTSKSPARKQSSRHSLSLENTDRERAAKQQEVAQRNQMVRTES